MSSRPPRQPERWLTIERPTLRVRDGTARVSHGFTSGGVRRELWYEVEARLAPMLCVDRCDAALLGLLTLAMIRGEHIRLGAAVSEQLHHALSHGLVPILTILLPQLSPVRIVPDAGVSEGLPPSTGVGAAFSGGIDSFCTVVEHTSAAVSPGYRISHLVHTNVGAHGPGGRQRFRQRAGRLQACADELGLPLVLMDSNLHELLVSDFSSTHSLRHLSAALMLQPLFRRFLYSSAYSYRDCDVVASADGGAMDPMALHLMSTEAMQALVVGCQHTRIDKTLIVSREPLSYRFLDVCVEPESPRVNCSRCWKCLRTLLTLEMLGVLERYGDVFDLDLYRSCRAAYIATLPTTPRKLCRDVLLHALAIGYPLT